MHEVFAFEYQCFMFSNMFFRANTCFKTFSICAIVFIFATTNIACIAQCRREGGNPVETERAPSVQARVRNRRDAINRVCTTREWEKMNPAFQLASAPLSNQRSMTG